MVEPFHMRGNIDTRENDFIVALCLFINAFTKLILMGYCIIKLRDTWKTFILHSQGTVYHFNMDAQCFFLSHHGH
jgi:hypothetical protein